MAFFISQLSDEWNKCKDFFGHNTIKTLHFESDLSTTHQILGPLFKDTVPSSITNLLNDHCLVPLRRVWLLEVGHVEAPKSLALDYCNQGSLGRTDGKILRPGMEVSWHLRCYQTFECGNRHGQRTLYGSPELLVLGHQYHDSPPWPYRPQRPWYLCYSWDFPFLVSKSTRPSLDARRISTLRHYSTPGPLRRWA